MFIGGCFVDGLMASPALESRGQSKIRTRKVRVIITYVIYLRDNVTSWVVIDVRYQTEIDSQNLSVITRIIPENDDEAKSLVEIQQELRDYLLPHIPRRMLIPASFNENSYYIVLNLKQSLREPPLAQYFIQAMKFSQDLFYWLSARNFSFPLEDGKLK